MAQRNGSANGNCPRNANGTGSPALKPVADAAEPAPKRGRPFERGNTCGKGNPFYRQMAAIRKAIVNDLGTDAILCLVRKLYQQGMDGDVNAARVVLMYAVGKPQKVVDPDGADADEWCRLNATPTAAQVLRALLDGIGFAQAAEMLQRSHERLADEGQAAVLGRQDNRTLTHLEREADHRVGK
jgi:hypothetical protein